MPEHIYSIGVDDGDDRLIFAPLLNIAALMNNRAAELLRSTLCRRDTGSMEASLEQLAGALSVGPPVPSVPTGPADPPFLGLILTRACNMGCLYCDFASGQGGGRMSEELVSDAVSGWVDWVTAAGGKRLDLHFFGGEPFTEPDLVEIAIHRARFLADQHGLDLHAEASTNGLLGPGMLSFVRDHFGAIVLSLDGQAQDHDRHRPLRNGAGSFGQVWRTAEALAESHVDLCIRGCVSQANVGRMVDITRWLCETLRPESITFEPMKPSPESEVNGLRPPDPLEFARGFLTARCLAGQFGVDCVYSALYDRPRTTFCPVGRDTFIVAADRTVRSCYLRQRDWSACGVDMRIGTVTTDGRLEIDPAAVQRLRRAVVDRPRCAHCFCRWSCAGGCLVTETPPGHCLEFSDFCRQTRLIQVCALLDELGMADRADRLLADEEAVARIWNVTDDRLDGVDHG